MSTFDDKDREETKEWLEALEAVIENEGQEKAEYLLEQLSTKLGLSLAQKGQLSTAYMNTIPAEESLPLPGDSLAGKDLAGFVRWNAMAMVLRANKKIKGIGGHIASFASSGTLYEVGFNYFFNGPKSPNGQDLIFYQGHVAPGIYARAFVEGRLSEKHLENFRQEVAGSGLSSYPHPRLMPNFWQFPTVSMGLGPIMAIYQARFMKYLENRGFLKIGKRKVWAFLGDGETDEPETLGALGIASREKLDNLIFVLNCNLQRLDGPVRGNGKIIQEMEHFFHGAKWNVIKVLWGTEWDDLFNKDQQGILAAHLESIVDGDFQRLNAHYKDGAYIREHMFPTAELKALVKDMSDEQLAKLSRGGHDPRKVYTAFHRAVNHSDQPTVVIVQTVKGLGMASAGEAANNAHSIKTLDGEALKSFRDRFHIKLRDEDLESAPFIRPEAGSRVAKFMQSQREYLGGSVPSRESPKSQLSIPKLSDFAQFLESSNGRELSSTMVLVRILGVLLRNKDIKDRVVPIVPDEARTFGMEGLFKQIGIYAAQGQHYTPVDSNSLMWYKEASDGQLLEEGINEAGAFSSWIAAATSYANNDIPMIPFYIYYSMFGFQRIGDLAWAAGDMMARGFLVGGTAGRTTLNGEGLQHEDGHNMLIAATIPCCVSYDPTFGYELAVIIQDGLERMYGKDENIYYYISTLNENYAHPAMPKGVEEGIKNGLYLFQKSSLPQGSLQVQLMGSGAILREVIAAADLLENDFAISADVWSALGINQLAKDAHEVETWNTMHKKKDHKISFLSKSLEGHAGPIIISTDYQRAYVDQISNYVHRPFYSLGTDGFGRSDSRLALRKFFQVDRYYVLIKALRALVDNGNLAEDIVQKAIKKYKLDPEQETAMSASINIKKDKGISK